jgi:hypothetical protein
MPKKAPKKTAAKKAATKRRARKRRHYSDRLHKCVAATSTNATSLNETIADIEFGGWEVVEIVPMNDNVAVVVCQRWPDEL